MLNNTNPTKTSAWKELSEKAQEIQGVHMRELFSEDENRFDKYSVSRGSLLFDYSKNRIDHQVMDLLLDLAKETKLAEGIRKMFSGDKINVTEDRAVLHTALRAPASEKINFEGKNISPEVHSVLKQMELFCQDFHSGRMLGYTGEKLVNVVNIGIGGSDLGPKMVAEALKPYQLKNVETFFVSNIDATHLSETLKTVDADNTLFIIASKSFTTQETMRNALSAKQWFLDQGGAEKDIEKHFIALSTNKKGVQNFGINPKNMFEFWDWVGGRFSMSSAIGLSVALGIGYEKFQELLAGMNDMDEHFRSAPFNENIPVLNALIGIWNINFLGTSSLAILPYDQYLHRFPAYIQQASMESNGKSVDRDGNEVDYSTGPIIWGEPGTNGQHAFYQLIHQGTHLIPCDFIGAAQSQNPMDSHHDMLMSNFFAQSEALMKGRTKQEVEADYISAGQNPDDFQHAIAYKIFKGNIPSNTLLFQKIDPFSLGQLIAMYEHKIFAQGCIWNIFSFDQWGVQLGKKLADNILPSLTTKHNTEGHDSSTNGLIKAYLNMR